MKHKFADIAALAVAAYVFAAAPAYAYIDPGMGSMILQGLIGAVAGGLFIMRSWWGRIASYLPSARKPAQDPAAAPEASNQ